MQEATLAIIKPDAVGKNLAGRVIRIIEEKELRIAAMKLLFLSKAQAEGFYYVHRDKPFFESLTRFMSEGPIIALVLRADDAISRWRQVMGATNPGDAVEGTIRKQFGESIERNAVHGSDAPETARFEIGYFFNALEILR
jgi:nucleoside-diphosphate kinase